MSLFLKGLAVQCPHYEYDNGNYNMHLGRGNANLVAYMCKGFRDWRLFGFVLDESESIGLMLDGAYICSVYGSREEPEIQSDDDPKKEQRQIDEGKTSVLVFYGTDNHSWMRRVKPDEFDKLVVTRFNQQPEDLYYNS